MYVTYVCSLYFTQGFPTKIHPVITSFLASKFRQQPDLSYSRVSRLKLNLPIVSVCREMYRDLRTFSYFPSPVALFCIYTCHDCHLTGCGIYWQHIMQIFSGGKCVVMWTSQQLTKLIIMHFLCTKQQRNKKHFKCYPQNKLIEHWISCLPTLTCTWSVVLVFVDTGIYSLIINHTWYLMMKN